MKEEQFNIETAEAIRFLLNQIALLQAQVTINQSLLHSFLKLHHPDELPQMLDACPPIEQVAQQFLRLFASQMSLEGEEMKKMMENLFRDLDK